MARVRAEKISLPTAIRSSNLLFLVALGLSGGKKDSRNLWKPNQAAFMLISRPDPWLTQQNINHNKMRLV